MHKTFIIGSIFNVPLQTKTAFLGNWCVWWVVRRVFVALQVTSAGFHYKASKNALPSEPIKTDMANGLLSHTEWIAVSHIAECCFTEWIAVSEWIAASHWAECYYTQWISVSHSGFLTHTEWIAVSHRVDCSHTQSGLLSHTGWIAVSHRVDCCLTQSGLLSHRVDCCLTQSGLLSHRVDCCHTEWNAVPPSWPCIKIRAL